MEEKFKNIYLDEANELLGHLEKALLMLETSPSDKEAVEQVFRVMHTFKGSSNMFGLDNIVRFTHHLETIYDNVRNEKLIVDKALLNITLSSLDHLREAINDPDLTDSGTRNRHQELMSKIIEVTKQNTTSEAEPPAVKTPEPENATIDKLKKRNTYYIYFHPDPDIFLNGLNPIYIIDELHALGKCKVFANIKDIPELNKFDPETNYISWEVYLSTIADYQAIKDIFVFVEHSSVLDIQLISNTNLLIKKRFLDSIKQLASTSQKADPAKLIEIADSILNYNSVITDGPAIIDNADKTTPVGSVSKKGTSSIRVSSEKLDGLLNMVSELVTTQARLSLIADNNTIPELLAVAENVEKISRQLRDNAFSICLIPLENMMTRFQRLVRDLSTDLNKEVEFLVKGADTELDKTIIESLSDPLMHILRNCLDHGIETEEDRMKKGKPKCGTITFNAFYSGTNVYIEIKDDGGGIDLEKIRTKAISKGMIKESDILSKEETYNLLFIPGFSTAAEVTDISGRGVGMDVVKRNIANLRGEIKIDSEIGKGTTTTIILPLTLSVVDGLLIKIDTTHFVIPIAAVGKCYEVDHKILTNKFNNVVTLDGKQIPYCYLREEFVIANNCPENEQIIIINYDGTEIGIVVDEIIGEYQAVLKPLGRLYQDLQIISGATILGDGTIALVLDTNKIIKEYAVQFSKTDESYEIV